jgi:hypothetical protein
MRDRIAELTLGRNGRSIDALGRWGGGITTVGLGYTIGYIRDLRRFRR